MTPRYRLIEHADGNAGFAALLTYTLNGVRVAETDGAIAVVHLDDRHATNWFLDPDRGDNVWEYYFEPVMGVSSAQLEADLRSGLIGASQVYAPAPEQILHDHHHDPDRAATFWAGDEPGDRADWLAEKRSIGRELAARHVHLRPELRTRADAEAAALFEDNKVLGIHARGTDFFYASPTPLLALFAAIDRFEAEAADRDHLLFLATDQEQFVAAFEARYGSRVVTRPDAHRSRSSTPPFKDKTVPAFERGLDVLLDIALLARTDFVFKGASAVGEWALWLNPELDCWDAAIDATYRPGPGSHHAPAWELLNPAQIAPGRWWLVRRARGLRRLGSRAREHLGRLRRRGHSAPIQPDAGPKSR